MIFIKISLSFNNNYLEKNNDVINTIIVSQLFFVTVPYHSDILYACIDNLCDFFIFQFGYHCQQHSIFSLAVPSQKSFRITITFVPASL